MVMGRFSRTSLLFLALMVMLPLAQRSGHAAEMRFALVVGNDEYKTVKLSTPANDAGLIADALQAAGFTVTGARNLDQATLRELFREFLGRVAAAGPDAVAVVYFAGFGLQFEGENYFVPIDADLLRDVDIPLQAVRISDFTQPLAALPGRVKIVILDAARQNLFARGGQPLASGLALVDPSHGMAVAFNAAPGTVGPEEPGPYGSYATALAEMIAAGGFGLDDIFARVRLRVSEVTKGAEIPWYVSRIDLPFFMTERAADAPPPPNVVPLADIRGKPMRDYSHVDDAFAAALALDTIEGYEQFLVVYPNGPFSRRIAAMLFVRREEVIWRRCVATNTPPAYWSYLRRYPNGPHVWDARRQLTLLGASIDLPPTFVVFDFGFPPPRPDELAFMARPILIFEGPEFAPLPPLPVLFLPVRPREFVGLPPPPPVHERFSLPTPAAVVAPAFVRAPASVVVAPSAFVAAPNGRPAVLLPAAVHPEGAARGPTGRPAGLGIAPAIGRPEVPSAPPSSASVKPVPLPHAAIPVPAMVNPTTPRVNPGAPAPATHQRTKPQPIPGALPAAAAKPVEPPPIPTAPVPATVKPEKQLPPPGTSTVPAAAAVKPAKSPQPSLSPGQTATVKPAIPVAPAQAVVKPEKQIPPPPRSAPPATAPVKTATPPPPPPPSPAQTATVKPAVPPPATAAVKTATPPPPPPPSPAQTATVKPAVPPPAHPMASAGKPGCPPGKALVNVNGQAICK